MPFFANVSQQVQYGLDLLHDVGLLGACSVFTPLEKGSKFATNVCPLLVEPDCYCRLIGLLLYLSFTCLDITYTVQQLSKYVYAPPLPHWEAAIHLFKYLRVLHLEVFFILLVMILLFRYFQMPIGLLAPTQATLF